MELVLSAPVLPTLVLLAGIVLLCAAARRRLRAGGLPWEVVCTFQLCACSQELLLLSVVGRVPAAVSLSLLYLITLVHCNTCAGAVLNPLGALQLLLTGRASRADTGRTLGCQALGAWLAWRWAVWLRALPVSALHEQAGSGCSSCLHSGLWQGAGAELACAFTMASVGPMLPSAPPLFRPYLLALVVILLVYAAGPLTGAMFNPALAFSLNFFCKGNSILENVFVYWLGPLAGMILSVMLFDRILNVQ